MDGKAPFPAADVAKCVKILRTLEEKPSNLEKPWASDIKEALVPLSKRFQEKTEIPVAPGRKRYLENKMCAEIKASIREKHRRLDNEAMAKCRMRSERIKTMNAMIEAQGGDETLLLIPDGTALGDYHANPLLLSNEPANKPKEKEEKIPDLNVPVKCYVCWKPYTKLHHFYHALCPPCAKLNFEKREQSADLHGKIALVTGSRVKVGYHVTLKLLLAGATVIATTRFPVDAAERFVRHPQYKTFRSRLHFFGVDLRDLVHLHTFLDFVASTFPRLDMIIHNAAQTVRRPTQYYSHLVEKEVNVKKLNKDSPVLRLLRQQSAFHAHTQRQNAPSLPASSSGLAAAAASTGLPSSLASITPAQRQEAINSSALKSQIPLTLEDNDHDPEAFPLGKVDVNGQQVDLRTKNSWVMKLGEIETPEVAEVLAINTMAPFVINNRLLPMMERTMQASETDKGFIINVSAMEGKFYRHKQPTHPHTNMAKAALNMMTRTCGPDLAQRRIYMNSVDTGWINDEKPLPVAHRVATDENFQTPLDEIDAAARVLDPIFAVVNGANPTYGRFLKDYFETEW